MINEELIKLARTAPTTFLDISQLMSLLNYRNELIINKREFDEDNYIIALQHINNNINRILQL